MVTGTKYYTGSGQLSGIRETQSHKNLDYTGVDNGIVGLPDKPVTATIPADGKSAQPNATANN